MKDYVTKEEFKKELKEVAESGHTVWFLIGALQVMFGLHFDQEIEELVSQIMENEKNR